MYSFVYARASQFRRRRDLLYIAWRHIAITAEHDFCNEVSNPREVPQCTLLLFALAAPTSLQHLAIGQT